MTRTVVKNEGDGGGNGAISLKHLHAVFWVAGNFCRFLNRMVIIGKNVFGGRLALTELHKWIVNGGN